MYAPVLACACACTFCPLYACALKLNFLKSLPIPMPQALLDFALLFSHKFMECTLTVQQCTIKSHQRHCHFNHRYDGQEAVLMGIESAITKEVRFMAL